MICSTVWIPGFSVHTGIRSLGQLYQTLYPTLWSSSYRSTRSSLIRELANALVQSYSKIEHSKLNWTHVRMSQFMFNLVGQSFNFFMNMYMFSRLSITSDSWSLIARVIHELNGQLCWQRMESGPKVFEDTLSPWGSHFWNLARFFNDLFQEYGRRKGYAVTITTDSAPNMITAAKDAG